MKNDGQRSFNIFYYVPQRHAIFVAHARAFLPVEARLSVIEKLDQLPEFAQHRMSYLISGWNEGNEPRKTPVNSF